jgi:CYTH domain-containing protein
MPIEHELKFVLDPKNEDSYINRLGEFHGVTHYRMIQGYLDGNVRVRKREPVGCQPNLHAEHFFTYKTKVNGEQVEIETHIDPRDYDRLWSKVDRILMKERVAVPSTDGNIWEIDFFKAENHNGSYFIMAEVELEQGEMNPGIPDFIEECLIHRVELGDKRFNSKNLTKPYTALELLDKIKNGKL